MAKLELTYYQLFPEDGDPGWHASRLPDGRRVHATRFPCNTRELHWAGSVEDPDRCECDQNDGTCNLCLIRENGGLVFTRVTGCYRSANSAVRALQQWAANPDAPPQPSPWQCERTTMRAVICDEDPNGLALPLGTTESVIPPSQAAAPPADPCGNDHADMLRYWTSNDIAPTPCPKCGKEPNYIHLAMSGTHALTTCGDYPNRPHDSGSSRTPSPMNSALSPYPKNAEAACSPTSGTCQTVNMRKTATAPTKTPSCGSWTSTTPVQSGPRSASHRRRACQNRGLPASPGVWNGTPDRIE